MDNIRAVRNDSIAPGIGLITFPQLKLLRVLTRQFPDGARLKELAGELRLTPGTVSTGIENLVRQGLLQRSADPADRRAVVIRLTDKGSRCRDAHFRFRNTVMDELLRDIPPEELDAFIAVLEKLNAGLRTRCR